VSDKIDPKIIEDAPVEPEGDASELASYAAIGQLSEELAKVTAERDKLLESREVVIARMLKEYVDKVFLFVAWYCGTVGLFIFLCGLNQGFVLPEPILGIIAGSTAVSVIGLIGLVITGLFGNRSSSNSGG
jgi:hypothetical protein